MRRLTHRFLALALAGALTLAGTSLAAASAPRSPSAAASRAGTNVVSFALAYVGSRYAYMGDTPYTGFSCTGFVHWVYSHFGYSTPEDPYSLSARYTHVSTAAMMPGDVLLFANTFHPGLSHAAIYIGNGQMVGADNFSVGVRVDSVWDSYWAPRFVTAVRVTPYGQPSQDVQGFSYTRPSASSAGVTARAAGLHLRRGPSTGYAIVATVGYGTALQVLGRSYGWLHVTTPWGAAGWVSASLAW